MPTLKAMTSGQLLKIIISDRPAQSDLPACVGMALAVHCGEVARSGLVASILAKAGRNVSLVAGGMNAWREQGYPEVRETAQER